MSELEELKALVDTKAANCERNLSNEFDWLKHRHDYNATPHFSDGYVASEVRMLMRGQLNHEAVVTTAANRISKLAIENADLISRLQKAEARAEKAEGANAELKAALAPFAGCAGLEVEAAQADCDWPEDETYCGISFNGFSWDGCFKFGDLRNASRVLGGGDG